MKKLSICEVGPRDGLQNLKRLFSVAERISLINDLARTGLRHIEAVSFVDPRRVPQMAEPEAVLAGLDVPDGIALAGLCLNEKGVLRGLETRIDEVRYLAVASETFCQRNQNIAIEGNLEGFERGAHAVREAGRSLTAVVAVAFGCPFEGEVPADRVRTICQRMLRSDPDTLILADTIGVGVPTQVTQLAEMIRPLLGRARLGFHFHNTRNTGYANAIAAIAAGAEILDSAVGGLGGCPFAPNATGNIATEDLVYMLSRSGISAGVEFEPLLDIVGRLRLLLPGEVTGRLESAGLFPPRPADD